jgi:hypothetical protein
MAAMNRDTRTRTLDHDYDSDTVCKPLDTPPDFALVIHNPRHSIPLPLYSAPFQTPTHYQHYHFLSIRDSVNQLDDAYPPNT